MARIYLSSTYSDLVDHRERVCRALRSVGHDVTLMEEYTAADQRPVKQCLGDVQQADIYIGIFGQRYGYVPNQPEDHNPDQRSITELEYRQADSQAHTCCLIFLSDDDYPQFADKCKDAFSKETPPEKIEQLRSELSQRATAAFFRNADDLAKKVLAAVINALKADEPVQSSPSAAPAPSISWTADQGPPYPGLMRFDQQYAAVFFGRELETRELVNRFCEPGGRLLIVSGASGSGKSSLVDAGLLEHLRCHGLPGAETVSCVRMVPSWPPPNAFAALLTALAELMQRARLDLADTTQALSEQPQRFKAVFDNLLSKARPGVATVLFIDQFEELFAGDAEITRAVLDGLFAATQAEQLRVVVTIRSDQLHPLYQHDGIRNLLSSRAHYCLGPVTTTALSDLMVKPAACAGVDVPPGLVCKLLEDVDREPDSLPLLAFALRRLFELAAGGAMSEAGYEQWGGQALGRLAGAIAEHAEEAESKLATKLKLAAEITPEQRREHLRQQLAALFPRLVRVNLEGVPLRRPVALAELEPELRDTALALADERLLVTHRDQVNTEQHPYQAVISIAHERLFTAWPTLATWIEQYRSDLVLLRRAEFEAADWQAYHYDSELLWPPSRLRALRAVLRTLPEQSASPVLRRFALPQRQLCRKLKDPALDHTARRRIGDYLTELGDPRPGVGCGRDGLPAFSWVTISGGRVELEDNAGANTVADFRIARYPVTNAQFQAFIEADNGYKHPEWWRNMPEDANNAPLASNWPEANAPRESVSWYEAVAFCRWLSACGQVLIDLPTEFEWQLAATGGNPENIYPWGSDWDPRCANSDEAKLNRTSVVGLYPHATRAHGPLDMAGNVYEWCLNQYTDNSFDDSKERRVVRGGSWNDDLRSLRSAYRGYIPPRLPPQLSGVSCGVSSPSLLSADH